MKRKYKNNPASIAHTLKSKRYHRKLGLLDLRFILIYNHGVMYSFFNLSMKLWGFTP